MQAGLSLGVVLIQSHITGGSLHASRSAITYKRTLAVIKPTLEDACSKPTEFKQILFLVAIIVLKKWNC